MAAAIGLLAGAWASDRDLLVERGRTALDEGRPELARELLSEAAEAGPVDAAAYRAWLEASERAGLGERAAAELADRATRDDAAKVAWTWWQVDLGLQPLSALSALADVSPRDVRVASVLAARRAGDRETLAELAVAADEPAVMEVAIALDRELGRTTEAAAQAVAWARERPEHPEVLAALWPGPPDAATARARRAALKAIRSGLREPDPTWLLRSLRVAVEAGDDALTARIAEELVAAGLPAPIPHGPWNGAMREAMGRTLALGEAIELPSARPVELHDLVVALAEAADERGRPDLASSAWAALVEAGGGFEAARGRAEHAIAQERWPEGLVAARRAAKEASAPARDDVDRTDTARQAAELAVALGLEAECLLGLRRADQALPVAWLARLLDPHPRWEALWLRSVASLGPGTPQEPAKRVELLRAARTAGDAGDRARALSLAHEALVRAAHIDADGRSGSAADAAAALRLRATFDRSLGDATIASLLAQGEADLWALRAELQRELGWRDAAFASLAVAGALGAEVDLASAYTGLGTPEVAAAAIVDGAGEGIPPTSLAAQGGRRPPDNRPRVGWVIPAWDAVGLDGASVSDADLRGHPYVLAAWASWCAPCLEELPEIDALLAELRAEGLVVEGVAVSVDEDERAWRRAADRHRWGLRVAHQPGLARELAISGIPATWLVGADGHVILAQTGYDEGFAATLERAIRGLPRDRGVDAVGP